LHHYKHETFYSFPTPINLFEKTLKDEKTTKTRDLKTPIYKELTSSEQKQKQKIKAKRSTSKREHSLNDKK
jgi:hypothetical protein